MISTSPDSCVFQVHRKVLNSLTWDVWFSFINSNLLMFQLPGFCCKNSYIPAFPLPLQSSPSELSERLPPGLKSSASPSLWIKHNSQLLGCAFFSVDNFQAWIKFSSPWLLSPRLLQLSQEWLPLSNPQYTLKPWIIGLLDAGNAWKGGGGIWMGWGKYGADRQALFPQCRSCWSRLARLPECPQEGTEGTTDCISSLPSFSLNLLSSCISQDKARPWLLYL